MPDYFQHKYVNLTDKVTQGNIVYEQPLNQRVRNFLRLEHLFSIAHHHSQQQSIWDTRENISCLFEILDLVSRSDIKNDLTKELERSIDDLNAMENRADIDDQKLNDFLKKTVICLNILRNNNFKPDQKIKRNELIQSIKQRITIPGGTCSFDLPAFHHWLNSSSELKSKDLMVWWSDLFVILDSLDIILFMLRNTTVPAIVNAKSGFYQQTIKSQLFCQLIRIILPIECDYFPEISGGQHRFAIRFMALPSGSSEYVQTKKDIEFSLHCCFA